MDIASLGLSVDSNGFVRADKNMARFNRTARQTEQGTERLTRSFSMLRTVLPILSFAAMAASAQRMVRTFAEFESSMARVNAVSRATASEFTALTAKARELGATTEFTATQAASGLEFLARAGWSANESIAALPAVLNLATAASMDLGAAADVASNIMSAFGIAANEASSVADVLAAASSRANTDVQQLGNAMAYVGPVAAALKIPMGDAAAAVGALSDAGIQGSAAGTGLRRVLSSLANPTGGAAAALKSLGVELESVNPATNSLVDIVDRLSASGMSAADALTIFGDRGGPAILALVENNAKVRELSGELRDVGGEAERMAGIMRDTLTGDMQTLGSAMQDLSISIGSAFNETNREAIQSATSLVRTLGENMDTVVDVATVLAAIVGTRLTVSLGSAAAAKVYATQQAIAYQAALARMAGASRTAAAASTALRGSLALVGGPAGAAILAAGAIYYFATRSSEAEKIVDRLVPAIDDATQALKNMSSAEQELRAIQAQRELHAVNKQMQDQKRALDELADGYKEVTRVIQTGMGSALQTVRVRVSTEELLTAQTEMERTQKAANLLSAEIADLEFALDFGTGDPFSETAKAAEAASEAVSNIASEGFEGLMQGLEEQRILFEEGEIAAYRYSLAVKGFTPAEIDAAVAAKKHNDQLKKSIDDREKFNDSMSKWADDQRRSLESAAAAEKQYAQSLADAIDPMSSFEREAERIRDVFEDGLLGDISTSQLDAYIDKLREAAQEAAGISNSFDFSSLESGLGASVDALSKIQGSMEDGSKEAKVLADAMTVLSVAQGAAAIANAMASGDPYTAVFRAFAVAATLKSAGIDTGVSGGGASAASDAQATQGTGGVLGDGAAQSESIMKGVDITASATSSLVGISRAQLMALQSMQAGIAGATSNILRGGGDFNVQSTTTALDDYISDRFGGVAGDLSDFFRDPGKGLFGVELDFAGDWLDDLLGGSRDVINSGIEIAGGRINDLIDNTMVSAFQLVEEKKHFLDDKDTRRLSEALGDEVGGQFALVFGSMVDAVSESAEVLGFTEDQIRSSIAQFRVAATEISLMDLTGEEQNAAISAVFSDIFDSLAVSVVDYVPEFREAGESYAETLIRIATQTQVTQEAMSQLGSVLMDGLGGQDIVQMSDDLIKAAGGMESFITGFTGFVDKFATDAHKLDVATASITSGLDEAGFTDAQMAQAMSGGDALWALMQTITDPEQLASLFRLQDSFSTLFGMMDKEASTAFGLNIELLKLQGKEEEALALIRADALEGMSENNQALQLQIWSLQDSAAAAAEAAEAAAEAEEAHNSLAQAMQSMTDFLRGIDDQLLDILSPAHAGLERLVRAQNEQIATAQELGIAEEDLANMRRLHQLQLLEFAAGLEESIASLSDELFGEAESGMNRTVTAVGSGMNKVRDLMISGIAQVNDWLQSSMLSSVSPLTPEQRLGEAQSQFDSQIAAARGGDASAISGLSGLADQLLSEASGFFGGSTQEFDDIWMRVREAMQGVAGMSIPDVQQSIQAASESTALNTFEQLGLASDMISNIAALSRVTGENPADIADRLGVPIDRLMGIIGDTSGELTGTLDNQFNELVTGFDTSMDPLLSVQNAHLEATKQQTADTNERLERIEAALLDGVTYQRATAVNTGESANQQGQVATAMRQQRNTPPPAPRIGT